MSRTHSSRIIHEWAIPGNPEPKRYRLVAITIDEETRLEIERLVVHMDQMRVRSERWALVSEVEPESRIVAILMAGVASGRG